jgi:hypothetical protein
MNNLKTLEEFVEVRRTSLSLDLDWVFVGGQWVEGRQVWCLVLDLLDPFLQGIFCYC